MCAPAGAHGDPGGDGVRPRPRVPAMPGPMEGVKVVELGMWVAGPAAAGILGDWGADVVKVEPPEGDPFRAHPVEAAA